MLPMEHAVTAQCVFDGFGGPIGQVGEYARRGDRRLRAESDKVRLQRQARLLPHARSNSAEATSIVSPGQAIASSNGFMGKIDPARPFTIVRLG